MWGNVSKPTKEMTKNGQKSKENVKGQHNKGVNSKIIKKKIQTCSKIKKEFQQSVWQCHKCKILNKQKNSTFTTFLSHWLYTWALQSLKWKNVKINKWVSRCIFSPEDKDTSHFKFVLIRNRWWTQTKLDTTTSFHHYFDWTYEINGVTQFVRYYP